jgi:hypothetical protein
MLQLARAAVLMACLGAFAAAPAAALSAKEEGSDEQGPGEAARDLALDSIEKLMRAMELLLDSIPQYEAPFVNEDGDIIIRRKRDEAPDAPEPEETGAPDQEKT